MLAHWGKVGFPEADYPPMKQIFALFCAFVLLPAYTSHAWIGGPFSNNSHFPNAEDGVYEAIGTIVPDVLNPLPPSGVGVFRFVVGNRSAGLPSTIPSGSVASGNVFLGFFNAPTTTVVAGITINTTNPITNMWFINGVRYTGTTLGTVNEAASEVVAAAIATRGTTSLDTGFRANIARKGRFIPVVGFTGRGDGTLAPVGDLATRFAFTVFGTKVSNTPTFGF